MLSVFPSVEGGGGDFDFVIFSADSVGTDLAWRIQIVCNSEGISDLFFHIYFLETKALIRLPARNLICAFVVCMLQSPISHDKVHVHTIITNLNIHFNVYTVFKYTTPSGAIICTFIFILSMCMRELML